MVTHIMTHIMVHIICICIEPVELLANRVGQVLAEVHRVNEQLVLQGQVEEHYLNQQGFSTKLTK